MRKIKNLIIGGIENKIFNLILLTGILIAAAFIGILHYQSSTLSKLTAETSSKQQASISEITTRVMDDVMDGSMGQSTNLEAMIADDLFSDLGNRVALLGAYAQKLFDNPDAVPQMSYAGPDASRNGQITAQMILAGGVNRNDPALQKRLGVAANMSDMMISLYGTSELTNSCFIALPEGAFLIVDDRSGAKFDAEGGAMGYDPRTRPWYRLAVEKGGLIFTDVEVDAFTGDIGIVCAMPVYVDGQLTAVVGSDLFLTSMQQAVQASDANGGYVVIVNQNGHVVFSPRTEGMFRVRRGIDAADLRQSDNTALAALVADALKGLTDVRSVTLEDGDMYMAGAPIETVGWALINVFSREVVLQPVTMIRQSYEGIEMEARETYRANISRSKVFITWVLVALTVLLIVNALLLGRKIVRPLNTITRRISELSETNLEFKMEDTFRTGDEIEVLAGSFAALSHKTVEYLDEVRHVTAEKERFSTELHMATQIQESMLPSIFPAFPERREFDVYATMDPAREVGGDFYDFFLIDDDHLCIVMADVSGKGVPAALFMMASKIILQSTAMAGKDPAEILTRTNEAICSNNRMQMFVTVWLGILEINTGLLTCSNAGHEYPAIRKADSRFELIKDKHGFVIGGMNRVRYREYSLQLNPGDKLFLYTDGVVEATNGNRDMFGTERMLDALNTEPDAAPRDVLANVRRAVDAFVGDAEQFDDLTMLCLEYKGKP